MYLIPIIHMSADMGSIASTLDERATAKLTPELWQKHKEIIAAFWDSIGRFLDTLDVSDFRVYQDGLVADDEDGLRIIREGINQGSKNYEIIGKLLERGAVLVKTESFPLVKQEYHYITKMARSKSVKEREVAALRYKLARGNLLKQRDEFIAGKVNETLAEGENGILFIGAYHDVVHRLAPDIRVVQVKEVARVKDYHKSLINTKRNDQQLRELSEYLISPVSLVTLANSANRADNSTEKAMSTKNNHGWSASE
ncbi:MAG: hypothetical protein A2144_04005 [Chloroflexi bacterium RBG_16_50_9]|nr:MAG: hypothetical protein A2144_04005 [Chloroflexi bacterium RBG_16_50_9]